MRVPLLLLSLTGLSRVPLLLLLTCFFRVSLLLLPLTGSLRVSLLLLLMTFLAEVASGLASRVEVHLRLVLVV